MARLLTLLDNMRLQTRISVLVSLGLVSVVGLLTFFSLRVVEGTTDRIVRERLAVAEMTATYVDTTLQESFFELAKTATFASFDLEHSDLVEERHQMSRAYGQLGKFTQGLILLDRRGVVVVSEPADAAPLGRDFSVQPAIKAALESGHSSVSNAFLNVATNKPTVAVTLPLRDRSGKILSLLVGLIGLDSPAFANSLSHVPHLGGTEHADIMDDHGMVIASSHPGHVFLPAEHPAFYMRMLRERKQGVETTPTVEDGRAGEMHVMAFVPLSVVPWGVGLGGTETETFAPARRLQQEAAALGTLSLVVALVLVWLTTRRVVRPVEHLIVASERMASGDLSSSIHVRGADEVGRLAATFDKMRLQLQAAYNALSVEKSRYQGIFRSMADPVFTVDRALRITSFNPAAERLTGRSAPEVLGRRCEEILHPGEDDRPLQCRSSCPMLAGADPQASPVTLKDVFHTRHGVKVTVEVTQAPIFDEAGRLVGVVHLLRDISAREELDRMKEQFISNVSHELRSPLGHIKGYATTLLRRDARWDEKTSLKFLREIVYGSEKLEQMVGELLDVSRLEEGRFRVDTQPMQVHPVARVAVKWVRSQTQTHKLVIQVPRGLPLVLADPHRTEQVLRNLLENAVKYSPEGGTITLKARGEDDAVVLSVADEGIGIAEEQRESIFERFHRVDNGLARQAEGVGLGLSICQKIVEAHGGRIWVDSAPGQGSTFYFSLPIFEKIRSGRQPIAVGSQPSPLTCPRSGDGKQAHDDSICRNSPVHERGGPRRIDGV